MFEAIIACWSVAVGAGFSGWVFGTRVTLLHVALAFNADQGVKTVEASWEMAVGTGGNVVGDGTDVAASRLWVV